MVRECVCVHAGQAGIQIGNACWELFCLEHGTNPCCRLLNTSEGKPQPVNGHLEAFNDELINRKFVPRACLIDVEPDVNDQVRTGTYKKLFNPNCLINKNDDVSSNHFTCGYYCAGSDVIDNILDGVRRLSEGCGAIKDYILYHRYGGSGFVPFLDNLHVEYGCKSKPMLSFYPAPKVCTTVQPHNAVLITHSTLHYSDRCFTINNEAIYDICTNQLNIDRPFYIKLNRLIGQVFSSFTTSIRFEEAINVDLNKFPTILIHFPRIHFSLATYTPIEHANKSTHKPDTVADITNSYFTNNYRLVNFDSSEGSILACCLLYGQVVPEENEAIGHIKRLHTVKFAQLGPTGFIAGINYQPPVEVKVRKAVSMIKNTTIMLVTLSKLNAKFDIMCIKEVLMYWYVNEEMEVSEFYYACKNMAILEDWHKQHTDLYSDSE